MTKSTSRLRKRKRREARYQHFVAQRQGQLLEPVHYRLRVSDAAIEQGWRQMGYAVRSVLP